MFRTTNISKLLQELKEKVVEDVVIVPQTMQPKKEAEVIAPDEMEDIENLKSEIADYDTYITTYCPDAYWILNFYGRKNRTKKKLKNMCELLTD